MSIPSTTFTESLKARLPCTSLVECREQRGATPLRSPPMVIVDDDDYDDDDDDDDAYQVPINQSSRAGVPEAVVKRAIA